MTICRMLSPGLLAALLHAESWVDYENSQSDNHRELTKDGAEANDNANQRSDQETSDYITKVEQALHRSLYLS